ncbi:MAG: nucleoside deaminase [Saprospiraceae bacterium]|nr:nucleoside deaminase [Saprospiraceae bacterium]MCF8249746.1 nucleoside deaminase [Saprospiraceae bacterium]MCF8312779.1 nucleoside deaminase [Saprospiraceae bacterium]MCF8441226.1 nucleoside deaminase [Saprospiraceae bacterium]
MKQSNNYKFFMQAAIQLAFEGMRSGEGGPFGAVVVKNGEIIGRGNNRVATTLDPTAHAEIVAIRDACRHLGHFQLDDCLLFTSCEPCPMCLGAIYWARPQAFYFACTKADAASIDFDDQFIYDELKLPFAERKIPAIPLLREEGLKAFEEWRNLEDKFVY